MDLPILASIGKALTPKKIQPTLKAYVAKAGYQEVPYTLFGFLFVCTMVLFYFLFVVLILPAFKDQPFVGAFFYYFLSAAGILLLLSGVIMLLVHLYFDIKIYERTKILEHLFPDYLTLVSTNLKGGSSFEQALWNAIKPEFGILANEMGLVSKRVMTGNDVTDALNDFMNKYDSPILRRNMELIISEFQGGGKIVKVIDKIIINLKKAQMLKKELQASTVTYMIFIGTLVTIICPVLFALSLQLFELITGFMGALSGSTSSLSNSINIGSAQIKEGDFKLFSILAITLTSIGSSALISIIERGSVKGIFRFLPIFLTISLLIYFFTASVLSGIFSGLMIG